MDRIEILENIFKHYAYTLLRRNPPTPADTGRPNSDG